MILIYMDESGDDGTKPGASPILSLACIKLTANKWNHAHAELENLLIESAKNLSPGFKHELHTRDLISNKGAFKLNPLNTTQLKYFLDSIKSYLHINSIKVSTFTIIKNNQTETYPLRRILTEAIKSDSGIQRIIISDRGRVPLMRSITHNARKNNLIQDCLIENILESESKYNRFIQLADLFATAAYIHAAYSNGITIHSRIPLSHIELIKQITEEANCSSFVVRL